MSVADWPGWIVSVSSSTPLPSISSACAIWPSFVTLKATVPGLVTIAVLGVSENSFSEIETVC